MKVRVYDENLNYFISEVYAIVNQGWYQRYLVLVPDENGDYLMFYDYIDKSAKASYGHVNIDLINNKKENWISKTEAELVCIKKQLGLLPRIKFDCFRGLSWIFDDIESMIVLLKGKTVQFSHFGKEKLSSNEDDWNYVETEEDISELMQSAYGFHDAILNNFKYTCKTLKSKDGWVNMDQVNEVSMFFESCWHQPINLVFNAVIAFNLRPALENYSDDIFSSTLLIKDKTIFFCDNTVESEEQACDKTWIKALQLKWRFADEDELVKNDIDN